MKTMIDMKIKEMFFDSKTVMSAVDRATRSVLSRFGAFVRTAAQSSIRKRKRVSDPGKPPSSHVGTLRRLIFFGYEPATKNVVIGPVPFGDGKAPELLEQQHVAGTTMRTKIKIKRRGKVQTVAATFKSRPFMGPALEQELPKLPSMWANSVRSGS